MEGFDECLRAAGRCRSLGGEPVYESMYDGDVQR